MSSTVTAEATARTGLQRELGRVVGERPGPTLVVVGGLHGNEPCGVHALKRVLAGLEGHAGELCGELLALAGNLTALAYRCRFVSHDLNRCWQSERVSVLLTGAGEADEEVEDKELRELVAAIEGAAARARGKTYVLDLHSTSGDGAPFGLIADTLLSRAVARHLPVPIVLGLEEELDGTMLSYLGDQGHVTIGFEGGQHDAPSSIDHAEAAVWLVLEAAGLLQPGQLAPAALRQRLAAAGAGLPEVVEVRHRHPVTPEDDFQMQPGFRNFQPVATGQVLAHDRNGPVRVPEAGLVLMPLYQAQGEDGFFLVRPFSPFWLRVSALLRRLRADSVVHLLPGVRRDRDRPGTYVVNRRIARWFALELFHLLGFRRHGALGDSLTVSRRPHDLYSDRNGGR
jgi:succinylglutamate desuccinylase